MSKRDIVREAIDNIEAASEIVGRIRFHDHDYYGPLVHCDACLDDAIEILNNYLRLITDPRG